MNIVREYITTPLRDGFLLGKTLCQLLLVVMQVNMVRHEIMALQRELRHLHQFARA